MLVAVCDFIYAIIVDMKNDEVPYFYISPILLGFTMVKDCLTCLTIVLHNIQVIAILLILSEYKRGVRSSGPPVILWISLVAYGSIKMWTILAKVPVVS